MPKKFRPFGSQYKPQYTGGFQVSGPDGKPKAATPDQVIQEAGGASSVYPSSPPVDPALEAQRNAANLNIATGDAWDTFETGRLQADYGNVNDPLAELNPYTRAGMLAESYRRSQKGATNSLAAQGQLYSGALQGAKDENERNFNLSRYQTGRSYDDSLAQILKNKISRYSQVGASVDQNQLDAILRALGGK